MKGWAFENLSEKADVFVLLPARSPPWGVFDRVLRGRILSCRPAEEETETRAPFVVEAEVADTRQLDDEESHTEDYRLAGVNLSTRSYACLLPGQFDDPYFCFTSTAPNRMLFGYLRYERARGDHWKQQTAGLVGIIGTVLAAAAGGTETVRKAIDAAVQKAQSGKDDDPVVRR